MMIIMTMMAEYDGQVMVCPASLEYSLYTMCEVNTYI